MPTRRILRQQLVEERVRTDVEIPLPARVAERKPGADARDASRTE